MLHDTKRGAGVCLGAATISIVEISRDTEGKIHVHHTSTQPHYGNITERLSDLLQPLSEQDIAIAVTGRKLRHTIELPTLSEPEAVEIALRYSCGTSHSFRSVISAGGETFILYRLNQQGFIESIHTGSKCASGTGEFFLQQIGRLGYQPDTLPMPDDTETPHNISGRCSVFCKSDCTHALNKGVSKKAVIAGLNRMMANRALELLDDHEKQDVILTGGCTNNKGMVAECSKTVNNLHIPMHADCFEALGAAIWALDHGSSRPVQIHDLNRAQTSSDTHPPLSHSSDRVRFLTLENGKGVPGDSVILGLDVGSTTTKAVIMRRRDKALLASSYLRTNGDPITACRQAFRELEQQLPPGIAIEGIGVTGSGRHLCALHSNTSNIINEIIAHARAAAHFDPQVDTLLEIGGQDAKYTLLDKGVAIDYAMNEACSAGTGSFLEESAKETLGIDMTQICDLAIHAQRPTNFNDQCSAFIGSDIKIATQNSIAISDILAGLVYSVCLNYLNRVKGSRPLGRNIFMQGGVCYNRAVPMAMAALTGATITVPPQPGLMGALGAALVTDERLPILATPDGRYHLAELAERTATSLEPFSCSAGNQSCSLECTIMRFQIGDQIFPFGGACSKYDRTLTSDASGKFVRNLVSMRQHLLYATFSQKTSGTRPKVGMNRSFLINSYLPFYHCFFDQLGYQLILSEPQNNQSFTRTAASFCYPVEIAHAGMDSLLRAKPDIIFLPHILSIPGDKEENSCTCVFIQSEPSLLKSAFPKLKSMRTISPIIDMHQGLEAAAATFNNLAVQLGKQRQEGKIAFSAAVKAQHDFEQSLKKNGRSVLDELEQNPQELAIVLFGRPYNSFAAEANKGIPQKVFGKKVSIIPFDMLPFDNVELEVERNMFWGIGRRILKAAKLVAAHPQLYGIYISNFSCGPDSFIVTHFRHIMKGKPCLTLEVDSHTADAGLDTRIEAFLEIAKTRRLTPAPPENDSPATISAQFVMKKNRGGVSTIDGSWVPLTDQRVRLLIPAMSRFGTPFFARSFNRDGIRALALPPANREDLHTGRANTGCKECLPMQTTIGSLLSYLKTDRPADEISLYFMPTAPGPCRFGQYHVLTRQILADNGITDVAIFSPNSKNCYGGLSFGLTLAIYRGMLVGDLFDEMYATLMAAAHNPEQAHQQFHQVVNDVWINMDKSWSTIITTLKTAAEQLAGIHLKEAPEAMPVISLVGEIYVRHDPLALQQLAEKLADRGFILRTAPNTEWIKYLAWLIRNNIMGSTNLTSEVHYFIREQMDRRIRSALAPSGLLHTSLQKVGPLITQGARFIPPEIKGEAILTIGAAFHDILDSACGVISIGPFGCMPARVAEAILSKEFTVKNKLNGTTSQSLDDSRLPFLAIETDGQPFPQVIEARLEAFCLQARRLYERYQTKHATTS